MRTHLASLVLVAFALPATSALADSFAVRADELHVGDGAVVEDATVVVRDGVVRAVGAASRVPVPAGLDVIRVRTLLPGLVATGVVPPHSSDSLSVDPTRLATDLVDPYGEFGHWLARGVTAMGVGPGADRLVGGRSGVIRFTTNVSDRVHVRQGPVQASLSPEALGPPLHFEPVAPVNVDNPLPPAQPQRPDEPLAAVGELRRLLREGRAGRGDVAFQRVARGETALRVRADRAEDIRRALSLARELDVDLIVEGGTEAWRLARELREVGALVALAVPEPGVVPPPEDALGEYRADTAAVLTQAGVPVALGAREWLHGKMLGSTSPLDLAAAAVRHGLSEREAIAAVTSRAARAAGADGLGRIRKGARADLLALDAPALSLRARPTHAWVGGDLAWEAPESEDDSRLLLLRAGTVHARGETIHDGRLLVRGERVAGLMHGTAVPTGAEVLDFGPSAHLVPGFVDAFSFAGLEPGSPPSGDPRTRAADAVEPDRPDLARALDAGVTTALCTPDTRGPVRGQAALVSMALTTADDDDGDNGDGHGEEELDVLSASAGMVFWLDGGPSDTGARTGRLKGLKKLLQGAKGYHDKMEGGGKKKEGDGKSSKKEEKPAEKPKKNDKMEAHRPLFQGKAKAFLRAGRADTMLAGLDAFKAVGVKPVLVGAEEADLIAEELAKREIAVVLGPRVLRREPGRTVNVAAELVAAGVPVAFGSFAHGGTELLSLSAASAVRHGLSPDDALAALTHVAGEILAAPEGVGRLRDGDRADAVVFSGDPLEPTSRVLAVIVRGRVIERGASAMAAGQ